MVPFAGETRGRRDAEGRLRAGDAAAHARARHRDHRRGRAADHEGAGEGSAPAPAVDGGAATTSCSAATARSATAARSTCAAAPRRADPAAAGEAARLGPVLGADRARDAARVRRRTVDAIGRATARGGAHPAHAASKERRKTLPMELRPTRRRSATTPPPAAPARSPAADRTTSGRAGSARDEAGRADWTSTRPTGRPVGRPGFRHLPHGSARGAARRSSADSAALSAGCTACRGSPPGGAGTSRHCSSSGQSGSASHATDAAIQPPAATIAARPTTTVTKPALTSGCDAESCGRPRSPRPPPTGRCRPRPRPRRRRPACAGPRAARRSPRRANASATATRGSDRETVRDARFFHILDRPEAMPSRGDFHCCRPLLRRSRPGRRPMLRPPVGARRREPAARAAPVPQGQPALGARAGGVGARRHA